MVRPGFKQTEVGEIPEDWDVLTLADLCSANGLVRGPFGGALKKETFTTSGYTVYEQRHAIAGSTEVSRYFINKEKFNELIRFQVKPGDLIISCSGTIGRIFRIPEHAPEGIINQALLKITLKDNVSSDFFVSLFKSPYIQEKIVDSSHGGAMPNLVGMDDFKKTLFQMPRHDEQKVIAKALSDVDELIVSLEKLIAKKRDIKTATMQQLLTGKTRLPGFGESKGTKKTELGEIPEDWEIFSFFEKVDIAQGQVNPLHEPYRSMVLIGPKHVESGTGKLVFTETAYEQRAISGKYIFMKGDVLYGKINPYLMKATLAKTDGLCSADMYPLRPKTDFSSGFLLAVILGEAFTKYAVSVSARSGMPKINRKEFAEFKLLAPTNKEEQIAIASILTEMDDEILYLQKRCAKIREIKQGMMQELLTGRTRLVDVPAHQVDRERLHGT